VTELEQRLVTLGGELAYPPEPALAPAVLARLEERQRRPFPWRAVAVALAVLAVGIGAAFAVPQARTAILRWFHLRGATVERVQTLPTAVARSRAGGLGRPLPRDRAEQVVGFRLLLPPFEGSAPGRVFVLDRALASVTLRAYGQTVLLSEYRSRVGLLKKAVVGTTVVDPVRVDGDRGLWLEGAAHTLTYFDRRGVYHQRTVLIRGNVLLWVHGDITLRLEGKLSKAQALRLARLTRQR
jgi:hypothetical protein